MHEEQPRRIEIGFDECSSRKPERNLLGEDASPKIKEVRMALFRTHAVGSCQDPKIVRSCRRQKRQGLEVDSQAGDLVKSVERLAGGQVEQLNHGALGDKDLA